jgi:hypothetical protein
VDAKFGLTPVDISFARLINKQARPALLVANKAEGNVQPLDPDDMRRMGMGEPLYSLFILHVKYFFVFIYFLYGCSSLFCIYLLYYYTFLFTAQNAGLWLLVTGLLTLPPR